MRYLTLAAAVMLSASSLSAANISGSYMEARTCQIYTGPCFANAEIGLSGKDALMAWKIDAGEHRGVDLSGLSVVLVVHASDTLAFKGVDDPAEMKSVILVDEKATESQRDALVDFARTKAGRAGESIVRVDSSPIEMSLDTLDLSGTLEAGKAVKLVTRKARPGDCICSNEAAYYPPLAQVTNFAPGVAIEGEFKGRGLGTRWSIPDSRSAYMATFEY